MARIRNQNEALKNKRVNDIVRAAHITAARMAPSTLGVEMPIPEEPSVEPVTNQETSPEIIPEAPVIPAAPVEEEISAPESIPEGEPAPVTEEVPADAIPVIPAEADEDDEEVEAVEETPASVPEEPLSATEEPLPATE